MPRIFRSLSGNPMMISDKDRILCIIMDEKWHHTINVNNEKVVGPNTALAILNALREEGFEIKAVS